MSEILIPLHKQGCYFKRGDFLFLGALPHPHAFVEGQAYWPIIRTRTSIPRTFPWGYSERSRSRVPPLWPVSCLLAVFSGTTKGRGNPGRGVRPVHQGPGLGAAVLPCSALLSSTCFFFPCFLFSVIYLGLAWFGGEAVKGFGQCRAPPHPLGQHVQFRGLSWSHHPCPARHGHARPTQHCPSLSALPTLLLRLSVRLSVCPLTPGPR